MIVEVRSGGIVRRITLTQGGAAGATPASPGATPAWTVELDGRQFTASLVPGGDRWSLLIGDPDGATLSCEVSFVARAAGELLLTVDGHEVPVTVVDPRAATRHGRSLSAAGVEYDGPGRVTAPMPGRIVKLLVAPGDRVEARQGVVVVEAMKMENELRAPKAGTVTAVHVQEGATVEAGATLVTIE